MPLYEFQCECGVVAPELRDLGHTKPPVCECGKTMKRKWSSFSFSIDFRDGYDIGLGRYFNTARERDYHIAKNQIRRIRD